MDPATRLQQKKLINRTRRRLSRLMDLLTRLHLSKRSNQGDSDAFQDFVRRSLATQMFNTGFSSGPFGLSTSQGLEGTPHSTVEPETEMELTSMCNGKLLNFFLWVLWTPHHYEYGDQFAQECWWDNLDVLDPSVPACPCPSWERVYGTV